MCFITLKFVTFPIDFSSLATTIVGFCGHVDRDIKKLKLCMENSTSAEADFAIVDLLPIACSTLESYGGPMSESTIDNYNDTITATETINSITPSPSYSQHNQVINTEPRSLPSTSSSSSMSSSASSSYHQLQSSPSDLKIIITEEAPNETNPSSETTTQSSETYTDTSTDSQQLPPLFANDIILYGGFDVTLFVEGFNIVPKLCPDVNSYVGSMTRCVQAEMLNGSFACSQKDLTNVGLFTGFCTGLMKEAKTRKMGHYMTSKDTYYYNLNLTRSGGIQLSHSLRKDLIVAGWMIALGWLLLM
ncbi:hypothetical protein HDU76_009355 [Blyttiomyces sp. JEL0837]|nr:hypothetical protein HDU76_009355 [Blyttiomyces sp. JEL0837]